MYVVCLVCLPSFGVETLLLITVKAYVDSLKPIFVLHSGFYHALSGGKQKTPTEYFMANHKLRTIPVALSILVSFVSGVVVLGTPAEMYTRCCNDYAFFLLNFVKSSDVIYGHTCIYMCVRVHVIGLQFMFVLCCVFFCTLLICCCFTGAHSY